MSDVQQRLLDIFFFEMDELSISTFYKPQEPTEAYIERYDDKEEVKVIKTKGRKGKNNK